MPTTSASLYEQLFALTTVMKQRVVENFSGDALNERWTTADFNTAPTYQMSDNIDGGFEIVSAATNNTGGSITFNNIRQFSQTSSVMIWIMVDVDGANTLGGLMNSHTSFSTFRNCAYIREQSGESNLFMDTGNASSATQTNMVSSPSAGTVRGCKIECKASSVEGTLNGTLEATSTTTLPASNLQPRLGFRTTAAASRTGRFRYCEVYNV